MLSVLSKYTRGSCKSYGVKVRPNHRKNVTRDKPLFWDNNPSFEEFVMLLLPYPGHISMCKRIGLKKSFTVILKVILSYFRLQIVFKENLQMYSDSKNTESAGCGAKYTGGSFRSFYYGETVSQLNFSSA